MHPDQRANSKKSKHEFMEIIDQHFAFFCEICVYIAELALQEFTTGTKYHNQPIPDPKRPLRLSDKAQATAKRGFGISPDLDNIDLHEPDSAVSEEVRDSIAESPNTMEEERWKKPPFQYILDNFNFTGYIDGDPPDVNDGAQPDKSDGNPSDKGAVKLLENLEKYNLDQRAGYKFIEDPIKHVKRR